MAVKATSTAATRIFVVNFIRIASLQKFGLHKGQGQQPHAAAHLLYRLFFLSVMPASNA
jgi:hypothetical protein